MNKIKLQSLFIISLLTPLLFFSQQNENAITTVKANANLIDQLAHLLPMGINPYATVFLTSILSKSGIHNQFVATNPFFDNWLIIILFGFLFLFTTLVGTIFKTNKATAVIGLADNYLSNHAAIFINIIVILAPTFFSHSNQPDIVQEAGILSIGLKTLVVLIVSGYFLLVVTTVRFFIDILIFLTPIPFIDSILEIIKIVITILFIGVSILYPTLSVVLSVIFFLIALTIYKKSLRLVSKTTYLFIYPILHFFKTKEQLLNHNDKFSLRVYNNKKTESFKRGTLLRLERKSDGFYLIKHKFFIYKTEEKINIDNCYISKGNLKSVIANENEEISLFLNRSYLKYVQEISEETGIRIKSKEKQITLNSGKGLIGTVKNMFDKADLEELKIVD